MSQTDKKDTQNPPIKDPTSNPQNPTNPSAKPGMKEDEHKTGGDKPTVKADDHKSSDGKSGSGMSGDSKR